MEHNRPLTAMKTELPHSHSHSPQQKSTKNVDQGFFDFYIETRPKYETDSLPQDPYNMSSHYLNLSTNSLQGLSIIFKSLTITITKLSSLVFLVMRKNRFKQLVKNKKKYRHIESIKYQMVIFAGWMKIYDKIMKMVRNGTLA